MPRIPIPNPAPLLRGPTIFQAAKWYAQAIPRGLLRPLLKLTTASLLFNAFLIQKYWRVMVLGGSAYAIKLLADEAIAGGLPTGKLGGALTQLRLRNVTAEDLGGGAAELLRLEGYPALSRGVLSLTHAAVIAARSPEGASAGAGAAAAAIGAAAVAPRAIAGVPINQGRRGPIGRAAIAMPAMWLRDP